MLSYQLCVNFDSLQFDGNGDITEASRNELEVTIVHEMMHGFMDEVLTNGMTGTVDGVSANDRFPLWFIEGMAQTAAGGYYSGNPWVQSLGINSNSTTAQISSALAAKPIGGSDSACNYASGYLASMYLGYLAGGKTVTASALQSGLDTVLNEIKSGKSLESVVTKLTGYNSLSDFQNHFATDSDVLQFVQNLTKFVGSGTGGVVGGFIKANDILPNTVDTSVSLFALDTDHDTVVNQYPAGYTVFTGGTATNGGAAGISSKQRYGMGVSLQVGANVGSRNRLCIYIDSMNATSIGVSDVDVTTGDSATLSLEMVALAINQVSAQRSELGAYQNRLEYTINNLANVVENTTAAESVIRDTDMAEEMVKYSAQNIISQAGQAVLVQGNQSKQGIRTLLGA
jgi:hypothetical protein